MDVACLRLLVLIIGFGLCMPVKSFGQDKAEAKETVFAQTAASLNGGCALQLMEYRHFPHFSSWRRMKSGDFGDEFEKRLQSFSSDLRKGLSDLEGEDYEAAASFVADYCSLARKHAADLGEKDLEKAADRALAPHTDQIKKSLVAGLKAKSDKARLFSAFALLALDDTHAKAIEVFQSGRLAENAGLVKKACVFLGTAHLNSPQAIAYLRKSIRHPNAEVRESAAGAVVTMGKSVRELVPTLIEYLKTGDDAWGSYYFFAVRRPETCNLALKSLEAMGTDAAPAVPTILSLYPKAKEADQLAMLACLASSGSRTDACLTLVRNAVHFEKPLVRITAACAVLHLAPGDLTATKVMKNAIADKATRKLAVEVCQTIGPPSKEVVASLLPFLDSKVEDERIEATVALARMGPAAREAVPKIAELLAKEVDHTSHTFLSSQAAAYALAKIGGKAAAEALLQATDWKGNPGKFSAAQFAMIYLPDLADDLPPTTVATLMSVLMGAGRQKDENGTLLTGLDDMAATALSNLGERARPVRRDLERLLDDPQVGWILDTALRRMPAIEGR